MSLISVFCLIAMTLSTNQRYEPFWMCLFITPVLGVEMLNDKTCTIQVEDSSSQHTHCLFGTTDTFTLLYLDQMGFSIVAPCWCIWTSVPV